MQKLFKCSYKDCGLIFNNENDCLNHEQNHKDGNLVFGYKLFVDKDCKTITKSKGFVMKDSINNCFIQQVDEFCLYPNFYCFYEKACQQEEALKMLKQFIKEYINSSKKLIESKINELLNDIETLDFDDGEI